MPLLNFTLVGRHATDGITSREMFQEVSSPTTAAATAAEVSAISDDDPPIATVVDLAEGVDFNDSEKN